MIRPEEETVAFVTGNGYKTIEALEGFLEPTYSVAPDLDEFLDVLEVWLREQLERVHVAWAHHREVPMGRRSRSSARPSVPRG